MKSIKEVAERIQQITAAETHIMVFGSVLMADIYLKPVNKIGVAEEINQLLLPLKDRCQVILTVQNDDENDVYARLIGFGADAKVIQTDIL